MKLTADQYAAIAHLNERRRAAEWQAEKQYRDALFDYSDGLRKARRAYDDELDRIEKEWSEKLQTV